MTSLINNETIKNGILFEFANSSITYSKDIETFYQLFKKNVQKNLLIKGSENRIFSKDKNYFNVTELVSKKNGGTNPVTNSISVFLYGEITDSTNNPINEFELISDKQKITISANANAPSTILIKYAVSYVSLEQAKLNFERELRTQSFDELSKSVDKFGDESKENIGGVTKESKEAKKK